MNLLNNVIPKEIFEQGINLSKIGINEYAWKKQNIENIIKILSTRKIVILGGDVYKATNDNIEMTYDSWYINNDRSKGICFKSYIVALNYIEEYEKNNYGTFLYTITIWTYVNFGKVIGEYVDKKTGVKTPTTWGTIHYGKKGSHIVPKYPEVVG